MKTRILFLLLIVFATTRSHAQQLRAELAMARFNSPADGPYLETYLKFSGNTLKVYETENGFHSEVVLHYQVLKEGRSVYDDLFKMEGPMQKSDSLLQDFISVQRIPLEKGDYQLVVKLRDAQDPEELTVEVKQDVKMEKPIDFSATIDKASGGLTEAINFFISDVELVDSYGKTTTENILSKNGYDLVPYTSNYFPQSRNSISFYAEIYNTDLRTTQKKRALGSLFKDKANIDKYLIDMFVENQETGKVMEGLRSFIKHDGTEVIPVLHSFSLEKVPTGSYNLVIELKDSENELLQRQIMGFQRTNPIMEPDYVNLDSGVVNLDNIELTFVGKYNRPEELKEYIRCLHPISNQEEKTYIDQRINYNDLTMMRKYLYYFWLKRNQADPEGAWMKYWEQVEKVNANYSTNQKKGYDTDRGRVYLQYGPPNTISPNYFEPDTYPYEIWHYYVLRDHLYANQSNKKFIFAQINEGTNDFILIHSDAKNEITNVRWNYDLHKRSSQTINLDVEDAPASYGNRSRQFFDNPY
ncbi:MAG: GWxTD domain-containing protein [Flavobacteriales bacterium]|nr:GWxTD domain-containing protein [Flavobacteriales bacterium]